MAKNFDLMDSAVSTAEVIEQPPAPCVKQKNLLEAQSSCEEDIIETEPEAGDMDAKVHQLQRQKQDFGQRIKKQQIRIEELEEHLAEFIKKRDRWETDIQLLKDRNEDLRNKCQATAQR